MKLSLTDLKSADDAVLIDYFLKSNDQKALSVLYQRYASMVYFKCLAMLNDEESAKDLAHDIFLKAFLKLNTLKSKESFGGWIKTITYNMCINHLNVRNKFRSESIDDKYDISSDEADEAKNDKILNEINLNQLEALLSELPKEDRVILTMKFQDDMSIKDIQSELSIGESAAKMRISRAKSRLAKLFQTHQSNI